MKIRKMFQLGLASLVSVSSLLTLSVPMASALSHTWTGAAGDGMMSTAGNWSTNQVPAANDDLVFPYGASVISKTVTNDIAAGRSFNTITFSGTPGNSEFGYQITGNAIQLSDGINSTSAITSTLDFPIEFTSDQSFNVSDGGGISFDDVLSGASNLTKTGEGNLELNAANTFTGILIVSGGYLEANNENALGSSAATTTIGNTASLMLGVCTDAKTFAESFNFSGSPAPNVPKLFVGGLCRGGGGGSGTNVSYGYNSNGTDYVLNGNITLASDITYGGPGKSVTLTGQLVGDYSFNRESADESPITLILKGSTNSTKTPNGTYEPAAVIETLSDNKATENILIYNKATITVNGTRAGAFVNAGGVLKGTGTVGELFVNAAGTVAPGNSPGCLTSGDLDLSGTYQFELGGTEACASYDQLKVNGTVDFGADAVVQTAVVNGFVPAVGQSYTIVSNDGTDAVTGTFKDLAQDATFAAQGVTYSVSYTGGDGNDVVLTVTAVDASQLPTSPDTGLRLVTANPLATFGLTMLAAGALFVGARRLSPAKK